MIKRKREIMRLKRRIKKIERRRRKKTKTLARRRRQHIKATSEARRQRRAEKADDKKRQDNNRIKLPENFNLTDNYHRSISEIERVREINKISNRGKRHYVDFDDIRNIGPAAALVLASEFHVSNINSNSWRVAEDSNWDPRISALLRDMGFHALLSLKSQIRQNMEADDDLQFLQFHSGAVNVRNVGKILSDISDKISDKFAGEKLGEKLSRISLLLLKQGIGEAVLNTYNHAYSDKVKTRKSSRWWISASVQKSNNEIKVICYDRGRSIPATLPLKFKEHVRSWLAVAKILPKHDALLIEAAMRTDRTRTGLESRGKGLTELGELIDLSKEGRLLVLSRRGKVTYRKPRDEDPKWETEELPTPIRGTLIVWSIILE